MSLISQGVSRDLRHTATGEILKPRDFFKHARGTPVGKGANFNYWYSGSLSTVGMNLGWTSEEMWEAVDRYRTRFAIAEQWRTDLQALGSVPRTGILMSLATEQALASTAGRRLVAGLGLALPNSMNQVTSQPCWQNGVAWSDGAYRIAFGAIGWPWLLRSLWGGTKVIKRRVY